MLILNMVGLQIRPNGDFRTGCRAKDRQKYRFSKQMMSRLQNFVEKNLGTHRKPF